MIPIDLKTEIDAICRHEDLSQDAAQAVFAAVMQGKISEIMLSALLIALKCKGETAEEIAGAARAMRTAALTLDTGDLEVADSCGTGGDGAQTFNISTAAALVAAAGGVRVAKHGNRSISSRCGSADVLERCGINIEASPQQSRQLLEQDHVGICFLFAPQYHAGVRHAMPVRRALGVRTIFNLLGPLVNPASPRYQLMGVYDKDKCLILAQTLNRLGCKRALVVHGGGLDEIAVHDETHAAFLDNGQLSELTITPESVGLSRCKLDDLKGGAPEENARWLRDVLAGRGNRHHQNAVAINAGALIWLCGRAPDHKSGTAAALDLLKTGAAGKRLQRWREAEGGA